MYIAAVVRIAYPDFGCGLIHRLGCILLACGQCKDTLNQRRSDVGLGDITPVIAATCEALSIRHRRILIEVRPTYAAASVSTAVQKGVSI